MFKELNLKSTYSSYEDDLGNDFYSPVISRSTKYDRATAFFSASALACYASGLEYFASKGNLFRLIISTELTKEDYEDIKYGYNLRDLINHDMVTKLQEQVTLDDERKLSNLAFLISIGVIDIKIAFTTEGIFHDKFGVAQDSEGNIICFRGSNNETSAAFELNYESFDITCSWQSTNFDYSKITKSIETFEKLWTDTFDNIYVRTIDQVVYKEIMKYNRGRLIMEKEELQNNSIVLDYDSHLKLYLNIEPMTFCNSPVFKLKLRRHIAENQELSRTLNFKKTLTYSDFKKIITIIEKDAIDKEYSFYPTKRLLNHINSKELYINERAQLGLAIKSKHTSILDRFNEYKLVVNNLIERKLREKQMWDSFFMCTMKKASNFSVPGSGKTSSVLGVFAFLKHKGLVKRIVMVGPKNSFDSWKDEFEATFGTKEELNIFNIHNTIYKTTFEKKHGLLYESGGANLILLNYDALRTYYHEAEKLIDDKTLLVFDEIHKIKAISGSNASKSVALAKNASYTIALTGTPIPNSYSDLFNLLDILYHDEYKDFFNFSLQQLKNPTNTDIKEINDKLQPFFCRTTKSELNVPCVNPDIVLNNLATPDENDLFKILCVKYSKNKLALIVRLLQLESNPRLLLKSLDLSDFSEILDVTLDTDDIDYIDYSQEVYSRISSISSTTKFKQCIDLSLKLFREGKTIIIWCIFVDSINNIAAELKSYGIKVGCIYGSTEMEERNSILSSFKNHDLDVLITNPHTLGESVSLHHACHDAIYFEYSYNLVHLLQSKDRIHRLGLESSQYTQYYYLMIDYSTESNNYYSLDEQIHSRLLEKEKIMLNAIENNQLEPVLNTDEDLNVIFSSLKFDTQ